MKDITSNCERTFLNQLTTFDKRHDGRELCDWRNIEVLFGADRGCCLVHLGNSRILSQVSCELVVPPSGRPNEGQLHINVELSPMAAPSFDGNRSSDTNVELSTLLERCIRDSRCIDLEALCIVAGEKVWALRVDVHALNHDGNLTECASVAAVASLAHFRRPDVTVLGADVTVHSTEERDPVPLNVLHMPFCTTEAILNQSEHILCDPTELEERVAEGKVVIGLNSHQEICTLHMSGNVLLTKDKIFQCAQLASSRVKELTAIVKKALEEDTKNRAAGKKTGFAHMLHTSSVLGMKYSPQKSQEPMESADVETEDISIIEVKDMGIKPNTVFEDVSGTYFLGEGGPNMWETIDIDDDDDDQKEMDTEGKKTSTHSDNESGTSEEEETRVLDPETKKGEKSSRGWYSNTDSFLT